MPILPLIDSKTTTPTQPKTTSFCPLKFFLKTKILNLKKKKKKKKKEDENQEPPPWPKWGGPPQPVWGWIQFLSFFFFDFDLLKKKLMVKMTSFFVGWML
jgi:hypothetical protein